MTIIITTD